MKKLTMAILLVLALLVPTFAMAEINLTVFDGADGFTYEYDDMTDTYLIESTTELTELMSDDKTAGLALELIPAGDLYLLRMGFYAFTVASRTGIGVTGCIIKADDQRYTASLEPSYDEDVGTLYIEIAPLGIGSVGLDMLKAITDAQEVRVRITGSNENLDFYMTDNQRAEIEKFYALYIAAGGDNQTLSVVDSLYPITVK